jgi:hypothetical protein
VRDDIGSDIIAYNVTAPFSYKTHKKFALTAIHGISLDYTTGTLYAVTTDTHGTMKVSILDLKEGKVIHIVNCTDRGYEDILNGGPALNTKENILHLGMTDRDTSVQSIYTYDLKQKKILSRTKVEGYLYSIFYDESSNRLLGVHGKDGLEHKDMAIVEVDYKSGSLNKVIPLKDGDLLSSLALDTKKNVLYAMLVLETNQLLAWDLKDKKEILRKPLSESHYMLALDY